MPRHPAFTLIGLRPLTPQHTSAEDEALRRHASGRRVVVELGVAEGGSALVLREAMDPSGTLVLVDPFTPGRLPVSASELVARRAIRRGRGAAVTWMKMLSWDAAAAWEDDAVDFLFVDADHSYDSIIRDFESWEPLMSADGVIAFHDTNPCDRIAADSPQAAAMRTILGCGRWHAIETCDSLTVIAKDRRTH